MAGDSVAGNSVVKRVFGDRNGVQGGRGQGPVDGGGRGEFLVYGFWIVCSSRGAPVFVLIIQILGCWSVRGVRQNKVEPGVVLSIVGVVLDFLKKVPNAKTVGGWHMGALP